jgi:hypothetical protein
LKQQFNPHLDTEVPLCTTVTCIPRPQENKHTVKWEGIEYLDISSYFVHFPTPQEYWIKGKKIQADFEQPLAVNKMMVLEK